MATDKHYNEPGMVPEALEDREPTDMPATRSMFVVIAMLAILALTVLVTMYLAG